MAKRKINLKSKKTWKQLLFIGLACLTFVGAIAGLSVLFKKSNETTKTINPSYAIGGLTENGAYFETKETIYTENAFECRGLKIELDFTAKIAYRVFFYDAENEFIEATTVSRENYDTDKTPTLAVYARIVITPIDDNEITWIEKFDYANQLTIKVSKNQTIVGDVDTENNNGSTTNPDDGSNGDNGDIKDEGATDPMDPGGDDNFGDSDQNWNDGWDNDGFGDL